MTWLGALGVATTVGVWLLLAWLWLTDDTQPWVRARRELDRLGRIDCGPRFDGGPRRDPSPTRRLTDYEWRAIAEGETQT